MDEVVRRYCAASTARDVDGMLATLAPDVELISPLSGRMVFRGKEDMRVLLDAVYSSFSTLRWDEPVGDGSEVLAISDGRVAGFHLNDAMLFEVNSDGLIRRIRPHLRPWLSTTVFALLIGPKVGRKPGVIARALKAGAGGQ